MSMQRRWTAAIAASLAALTVASLAWSQHTGESVLIQNPVDHDLYLAARDVEIRSDVDGDVVAAGQQVHLAGIVTGDALVAGETVDIRGAVSDDVRAVGRRIRIGAPVAGHLVAAGRSVVIEPGNRIGDWAWIAGQSVEVAGSVGGELRVAAQTILISGEIAGDVDLLGEKVTVAPGAVLRGDLHLRSRNEPDISPDAKIAGKITKSPLPEQFDASDEEGGGFLFTLSVIVAVGILYFLFPAGFERTTAVMRDKPWVCLGVGAGLFALTPLVGVLLMVTGIGAVLGLGVVGSYLVVLLLGALVALAAIGITGLHWTGLDGIPNTLRRLLAIALSVVAVALLGNIPIIGVLIVVAVWLFGLGALGIEVFRSLRNSRTTAIPGL